MFLFSRLNLQKNLTLDQAEAKKPFAWFSKKHSFFQHIIKTI